MVNTKKYSPIVEKLFDKNYQLIDGTDDVFELELALWEYGVLDVDELINRSAYFKLVDGIETIHYRTCNLQNLEEIHKNSSFRTKVFFLDGKYSTGYATHSLFPYRGKFHPQLIRALLNILEIKPGHTVLDPMAGSSTVSVEANLLGIDSISIDLSPFCELMGKVKTFSLNLDIEKLESVTKNLRAIFERLNKHRVPEYFINNKVEGVKEYYEISLLAYLDTVGFANRSSSSVDTLFPRVLERYVSTIRNFQQARETLGLKIGRSKIMQGNALDLPIDDNSIDAIITSPPYSFAIDYLKNDQPQLEYLGYSLDELRQKMIGLRGRGLENKLELYFSEMNLALSEMKRVTKNQSPIVIIVGNNEIQTKGVRLDAKIIELGENQGFHLDLNLKKPIRGLQNTMKEESILFFSNRK
ncbi:MAG: hypothetical protein LLF94_11885 [Chlamydiales bacterium]|nr:hypothetical protein [Chlamydiales bacterium]